MRRHRYDLAGRRADFQSAVGILGEDGEEAVVLVLGRAELVLGNIAVRRIVEQPHECDRLAVALAQLRRGDTETERERAEQAIAEPHQRVEITLDIGAKPWEVGPAIDAMQRLAGLHVRIVRGDVDAEVEALFQVGPVARIDRLMHRHVAAIMPIDLELHARLKREREEAFRRGKCCR